MPAERAVIKPRRDVFEQLKDNKQDYETWDSYLLRIMNRARVHEERCIRDGY